MKILTAGLIVFGCLFLNAESNTAGPHSPVVVGFIKAVNGKTVEVQTKDFLRRLIIDKKSRIVYVSFLGVKEEMKPGYPVKGRVDKGVLKALYITLPVPDPLKRTPDMLKMSAKELYNKTDLDKNGAVSYVELSRIIYNSPKHGPDTFIKADKDKSGELHLKEFEVKLLKVDWYRISRKSPEQWLAAADKDGNGRLSKKEFEVVNGGDGHIEDRFRRLDKDKSGDVDLEETTAYIENVVKK